MDAKQKDISDILNLVGVPHARWVELLKKYLELMRDIDLTASIRIWPIAGELLWASGMRANTDVCQLKFWAGGLVQTTNDYFSRIANELCEVAPLIQDLKFHVPEDAYKFESIVSHGESHRRSWLEIALYELDIVGLLCKKHASPEAVSSLFEVVPYDGDLVGLQLEIEKPKFDALQVVPLGMAPWENVDSKTTVAEYLGTLFWNESQTDEPPKAGEESAIEQTEKQTIEQTISDKKQTEVGLNSASEKKPWTDLATDLKKRWFAEIRKRKAWIPRKTFFIDFFAGSDGQRGKWKDLTPTTEDRRFQDNPDEWKAESEALKTSLKNRR